MNQSNATLDSPNQLNHIELQNKLNATTGNKQNDFFASEWQFQLGTRINPEVLSLDFSPLSRLIEGNPEWAKTMSADVVLLSKLLWLELNEGGTGACSARGKFDGICLLLSFMAQEKINYLDTTRLQAYLEYCLTYRWSNGPIRTLTIKSFNLFCRSAVVGQIPFILKANNYPPIAENMSAAEVEKALKKAFDILSFGDLTITDWKEGGSFNHLTLDYGRFYVDYCIEFFRKNIALATALARVADNTKELLESVGWKYDKTNVSVQRLLSGETPEKIRAKSNARLATLESLKVLVEQRLLANYIQIQQQNYLLSKVGINKLADYLNVEFKQHQLDRLQVIAELCINARDRALIKSLLQRDMSHIDVKQLDNAISAIKMQADTNVTLPTEEFYKNLGIERKENVSDSTYLTLFLTKVRDAGISAFLALTGWRKSEYAFPLSSIKQSANTDTLDQYAFPLRYTIKWHVFKTNGDTQTDREITYTAYRYAVQLAALHQPIDDAPALYPLNSRTKNEINSGKTIARAVGSNWVNFVKTYKPFLQLDNWNQLEILKRKQTSGQLFTNDEKAQFEHLLQKCDQEDWPSLANNQNLVEAKRRATYELPRIEFYLADSSLIDKKHFLYRYRLALTGNNSDLRTDWVDMFDKYLSEETKTFIKSASKSMCSESTLVSTISNELMEDCLYPTPHAFRHMWAEAVYRRFDGDAGWMIRSQFKHISQTMWLAYIRDKTTRRMHDQVKTNVISSLLNNWLKKDGREHAGKFHHYLRLLYSKTKISQLDALDKTVDHLTRVEIEDIKANPWGYCILRRRNKDLAKCAEEGIPQRHNASPRLCLDCLNNLTKAANVDYIIFQVEQHVTFLNSVKKVNIPQVFKRESYDTVRFALKHIEALAPDNDYIQVMKAALSEYEKTV